MNETDNPAPDPTRPRRCRRRGRTFLFGALVLGVAAVVTTGAMQALGFRPFGPASCGAADPALLEKKIDRIAGWVVEDLGGTPEQQARLAAIAKAAAKDLAPVHEELAAGHAEAVAILTAKEVDRKALEAHRARQMQLIERASERLVAAVADAADVLTPEQRVKAAEKLASHMARHGH